MKGENRTKNIWTVFDLERFWSISITSFILLLCISPEKKMLMSQGHCELYFQEEKEELLLSLLSKDWLEKFQVLPLFIAITVTSHVSLDFCKYYAASALRRSYLACFKSTKVRELFFKGVNRV